MKGLIGSLLTTVVLTTGCLTVAPTTLAAEGNCWNGVVNEPGTRMGEYCVPDPIYPEQWTRISSNKAYRDYYYRQTTAINLVMANGNRPPTDTQLIYAKANFEIAYRLTKFENALRGAIATQMMLDYRKGKFSPNVYNSGEISEWWIWLQTTGILAD